jgi:hypothetical protein
MNGKSERAFGEERVGVRLAPAFGESIADGLRQRVMEGAVVGK